MLLLAYISDMPFNKKWQNGGACLWTVEGLLSTRPTPSSFKVFNQNKCIICHCWCLVIPLRIIIKMTLLSFEKGQKLTREHCRLLADPSECNSSNRQNTPIHSNCCNFWTTNDAILMFFEKNFQCLCNIVYYMTASTIFHRFGVTEP